MEWAKSSKPEASPAEAWQRVGGSFQRAAAAPAAPPAKRASKKDKKDKKAKKARKEKKRKLAEAHEEDLPPACGPAPPPSTSRLEERILPDGSRVVLKRPVRVAGYAADGQAIESFTLDYKGDAYNVSAQQRRGAVVGTARLKYEVDEGFSFYGQRRRVAQTSWKRARAEITEGTRGYRVRVVDAEGEDGDWRQGSHKHRYFSARFHGDQIGQDSSSQMRRFDPRRRQLTPGDQGPIPAYARSAVGDEGKAAHDAPPPAFLPLAPTVTKAAPAHPSAAGRAGDRAGARDDVGLDVDVDADIEEAGRSAEELLRERIAALNRTARYDPETPGASTVQARVLAFLELLRRQIHSVGSDVGEHGSSPWQWRAPRLRLAEQKAGLLATQRSVLWRAIGDLGRLEADSEAHGPAVTVALALLHLRGLHLEAAYGGSPVDQRDAHDELGDREEVFTWENAVAANPTCFGLKQLCSVAAVRGPWSKFRGAAFALDSVREQLWGFLAAAAAELENGLDEALTWFLALVAESAASEAAAGFHERAMALYQALFEAQAEGLDIRALEHRWESEVPRLGDEGVYEEERTATATAGALPTATTDVEGRHSGGSRLPRARARGGSMSATGDALQRRNDAIEDAYREASRLAEREQRLRDAQTEVENAALLDLLEHGVEDAPSKGFGDPGASLHLSGDAANAAVWRSSDDGSDVEAPSGQEAADVGVEPVGPRLGDKLQLGAGFTSQSREEGGFSVYSLAHRRRIFISEAEALRSAKDLYHRTLNLTLQRSTAGGTASHPATSANRRLSKAEFGAVHAEVAARRGARRRVRGAEQACLVVPLGSALHQDKYVVWASAEAASSRRRAAPLRFKAAPELAEENPEAVVMFADIAGAAEAHATLTRRNASTLAGRLLLSLARDLLRQGGLGSPRARVFAPTGPYGMDGMFAGDADFSRPEAADAGGMARLLWDAFFRLGSTATASDAMGAGGGSSRATMLEILELARIVDAPVSLSRQALGRSDGRVEFLRNALHGLLRRFTSEVDKAVGKDMPWRHAAAAEMGSLLILFEATVCHHGQRQAVSTSAIGAAPSAIADARKVCQGLLGGGLGAGLGADGRLWNAYIYAEALWGFPKEAFRVAHQLHSGSAGRGRGGRLSRPEMELRWLLCRLQLGLPLAPCPEEGPRRAWPTAFSGPPGSLGCWRRRRGLGFLFEVLDFDPVFTWRLDPLVLSSPLGLWSKRGKKVAPAERRAALAGLDSEAYRQQRSAFWTARTRLLASICDDLGRLHRGEASLLDPGHTGVDRGLGAFDPTPGHFFMLVALLWGTYLSAVDDPALLPAAKAGVPEDAPMAAAMAFSKDVVDRLRAVLGRGLRLEGTGAWAAGLGPEAGRAADHDRDASRFMDTLLGDDVAGMAVVRFLRAGLELAAWHLIAHPRGSPAFLREAESTLRRWAPREPCALFCRLRRRLGMQESAAFAAWDRPLGWGGASLEEAMAGVVLRADRANAELRRTFPEDYLAGPTDEALTPVLGVAGWGCRGAETVRQALEGALAGSEAGHCPFVWRCYLALELTQRRYASARRVFFRAVHACPGSKELWMSAFRDGRAGLRRLFHDKELEDVLKTMDDRGLCLREEVDDPDAGASESGEE